MRKNLIVLAMLFSFVVSSLSNVSHFAAVSGSQQGFSSSMLVLVDKSVPSQNYYNYYADGVGKWLTWWKMGFEEIDVSTTTISRTLLDNYSVVLVAQFKLGDSGNLDPSELQAIYQAVTEDGVGLVQVDSYLLSYQNIWPNYTSLFDVTVHNWVTTTSKLGLTISSTPHFITEIYRPGTQMNYLFPNEAGEFKESDLVFQNVTAGQGAISIATMSYNSKNYPAVIVNTHGYGSAVLSTFSTGSVSLMKTGYDGYGERMNAKTTSGMNGLLWRSIVWAAKKPFAFMGMPPFMSYRVDDVAVALDDPIYMDKIIQYGFFGDFYLFQDDVARRGTSYQNRLKNYYLNGSAHFSPHSWTDSNSIYWNQVSDTEYPTSTLSGYFNKIDSQYESWGITPSAMYVSHYYQCGANALPFLRERGWLYTSQIYQIPYSNGAVQGNWIWESDWKRPGVLDYVDSGKTIFSTAVDMPVGVASYDYQDYLLDAETNVSKAAKQMLCVLEHGLSDLFWGQVFTHEQQSSSYDAGDWDKIFRWVVGNLTAQYPFTIKASGEYIARYIQNRGNLTISGYSFSGDTLTIDLSGDSTMPIALYIFTNSRIASYAGMLDYFQPYGDEGYMIWIPPYQNGHRTTITFGDVETSSPRVRFTTANITSTSSSPLQMTINSKPLWMHDKPTYFFEVDCSTSGRPESISSANGTPIQFSYDDATKIASFNRTLPLAGSDTILTWTDIYPLNRYQMTFDHRDIDNNVVDSVVTWDLFKGVQKISYAEGSYMLTNDTYTLKTYYHDRLINVTDLDTRIYGNTTVVVRLSMKSIDSGRIAFDNVVTSITIEAQTNDSLIFTAEGFSPATIIVDVPRNCSYIRKDGINQTQWVYVQDSPNYIYIVNSEPSNWELHFPLVPTPPPTYRLVGYNSTLAGNTTQFSCYWQDTVGLSGYVFSWNGTGVWTNDTWTAINGLSAWSNVTKTLPGTVGTVVGFRWYCNDTESNWNSTQMQTLTTTVQAQSGVFGKTTMGPSLGGDPGGYVEACRFQAPANGTITRISAYIRGDGSGLAKAMIYSDVSGKVGTLLFESGQITLSSSLSWHNFSANYQIQSGSYYWFAVFPSVAYQIGYDAGQTRQEAYAWGWTYPQVITDFSGKSGPLYEDVVLSIYVTYELPVDNTYNLTVSSVGTGSVSLNNTGPYHLGDVVRLTAVPGAGWSFSAWSGALTGSANPADLTVTGNLTVTAAFNQDQYGLTMYTIGQGSVVPGNQTFASGTVVDIKAINALGWTFAGWSGGASGSANTTVTMNGPVSVTATFTQTTFTLTVTTVGSGSVNLNNSGPYHYDDVVQLTAVPAAGWSFDHWNGDLTGSINPTTILIDGGKTATATFTRNTYTVTVTILGLGSVSLNNTGPYHYGDIVELTANPEVGWSFDHWNSDLGGSINPSTILINGDKAVKATFTQNVYTLTVTNAGSGSVNLNSSGPYYFGDGVELTAVPLTGWSFQGWSGDLSGSVNPATILINGNMSVTATFAQGAYSLTVSVVGSGSVVKVPGQASYYLGDVVELTAVPAVGWSFSGWSGGFSSSLNPVFVIINGTTSVLATFTQNLYTLTVSTVGNGNVNLNNSGPYHYGDMVQLTAVPVIGWGFQGWGGDLLGSINPSTILINGNSVVTATFMQQCLVTFYTDPAGSGYNITFQEQTYLNDTNGTFSFGTSGLATASAPSRRVFDHWISTDNVFVSDTNANPTTVTITSNGTLKAVYAPEMDFSVTRSPSSRSIAAGSAATFTVTASLLYGTSQSVSFSCLGLPPDATASFSPASGLPTFSSTLKISTKTSTPPGTYTITVAGSSQYASNWTMLQLKIMNFSVAPTPFSPNGDGVKDTTTVESTFWDSLAWTLTVKNTTGSVVRNLGTGTGSSVSMTWDGRDDTGVIVKDGTYTVSLSLPGLTKTGSVVLDTTRPTVTCSWSRSTFNPRSGQTSKLTYTLSEKCSIYIQIYDSAGNLVRTLLAPTTKNKGTFSVTWNGKDDSGVIVPSGTYSCKIFAEDMAGNQVSPYPTTCQIAVS
jgi:flagellar hook assembly protein FlgD